MYFMETGKVFIEKKLFLFNQFILSQKQRRNDRANTSFLKREFWKGKMAQGSTWKMKCLNWLPRSKSLFLEKSSYVTKGKSRMSFQAWNVLVLWGEIFMIILWIRKAHVWSDFFSFVVFILFLDISQITFPPLFSKRLSHAPLHGWVSMPWIRVCLICHTGGRVESWDFVPPPFMTNFG